MSIFSIDKKTSERPEVSEISGSEFDSRMKSIQAVLQARKATFFSLLVLVSGLLTPDHYARLGPIVWDDLLSKLHGSATVPVSSFAECLFRAMLTNCQLCFLLMQFAEKRPEQFTALVEENLARFVGNAVSSTFSTNSALAQMLLFVIKLSKRSGYCRPGVSKFRIKMSSWTVRIEGPSGCNVRKFCLLQLISGLAYSCMRTKTTNTKISMDMLSLWNCGDVFPKSGGQRTVSWIVVYNASEHQ